MLDVNFKNLDKYLDLISELKPTTINVIELKNILESLPNNHKIFVIEKDNKILGSITLILERKIIHNGKSVLHIEDLVIKTGHRGLKLGSTLLNFAIKYGENNNCYKIILNCSLDVKDFYSKCNFMETNIQMGLYL